MVTPKDYDLTTLKEEIGMTDFLKMYMNIRLLEEKEAGLSPTQKMHLQRDLVKMCRVKQQMEVVRIFEKIIADTYNNSGSLTDILNRVKIREQERKNVLSNT